MAGPRRAGLGGIAADVAVLLSERGLGGTDVDLDRRLSRWKTERGKRAVTGFFTTDDGGVNVKRVAIVGGGYAGLWTALELKRRQPSLDVAILEASVVVSAADVLDGLCVSGPAGSTLPCDSTRHTSTRLVAGESGLGFGQGLNLARGGGVHGGPHG